MKTFKIMKRGWIENIIFTAVCFILFGCGQPVTKETVVEPEIIDPMVERELRGSVAMMDEVKVEQPTNSPKAVKLPQTIETKPVKAVRANTINKGKSKKEKLLQAPIKEPKKEEIVEQSSPKPATQADFSKVNEKIEEATEVIPNPPKLMEDSSPIEVAIRPDHSKWNDLLQKYVSNTGKVDYKSFKSDENQLVAYCKDLAANPIASNWSREEKMAYWINAYNAFTIKLILDNYPIASIMDLDGGKPWDRKWIKLGEKTYSLNQIENEILRPKFKDARIHFAVNCAAKSCPPLLNQAWTATNLESNFQKQTKSFINNGSYNHIKESGAKVSKIFDWYGQDFGDLKGFINRYSTTKVIGSIEFMEYDWGLNE